MSSVVIFLSIQVPCDVNLNLWSMRSFCYWYVSISLAWYFSVIFFPCEIAKPEASVMAASIIDNGRLCTPDWKDGACRINGPSYFILHWSWYGILYYTSSFYFHSSLLPLVDDFYAWLRVHFAGACGTDKESNSRCWIWEPCELCSWEGRSGYNNLLWLLLVDYWHLEPSPFPS